MKFKKLLAAISVFAIGQTAVSDAFAEGYGHEFSLAAQSIDLDGVAADGQAIDYTYFPKGVDYADFPYAESAFLAQASFITAAINASGADLGSGSSMQWSYAIHGRFAVPETPYFAEAGYARTALELRPLVLSTAANYSAIAKTYSASAGMYIDKTTEVDFSVAKTEADTSVADASALTLGLHGKAILPVAEHMHVALELSVFKISSESGSSSADVTGYAAKGAWYFTRSLDASLGFGRGADSTDASAEYRTLNLGVGWFVEPELRVSFDVLQTKWDDNSKDQYITLRLSQRL